MVDAWQAKEQKAEDAKEAQEKLKEVWSVQLGVQSSYNLWLQNGVLR